MLKTILAVPLALLVTTGCAGILGWDTTPNAIDCGYSPVGAHVFVDGVTVAPVPSDSGQPAMTCATALYEVLQARDLGASMGWWDASQHFDYRIEFVNTDTVGASGVPATGNDWGYTVGDFATHDSTVIYRYDWPVASGLVANLSTVTLLHEMTHMAYGEGDHCNWSKRYAPDYSTLGPAQWASNFHDDCANVECSGSVCK